MNSSNPSPNRRQFLERSLLAGPLLGLAPSSLVPATVPATPEAEIRNRQPGMPYRRLAGTDLHFSALSLGGYSEEPVFHYGIERGVNLIHTCLYYMGGQAIKVLGKVLKTKRDKVYLALKDEFEHIDQALRELGVDYVDFLMFNRHGRSAASDPKLLDTFEKYRRQGKVRSMGLTSHGDVQKATLAGLESGMFKVVMPAMNQPNLEAMSGVLQTAQQKQVGVIAMKYTMGLEDLKLQTAYVKKAWAEPAVTTLLRGMKSFNMLDAYLAALEQPLREEEKKALEIHARLHRGDLCRMCDRCKRACPLGVEVSTLLRSHEYYWRQLEDRQLALSTYESVPASQRGNWLCPDCRLCEQVCPQGIPIVEKLAAARTSFREG